MKSSETGRLFFQSVGPRALHCMCGERLKIKEETHPLGLGCGSVETCRNARPTYARRARRFVDEDRDR